MRLVTPQPRQSFRLSDTGNFYASGDNNIIEVPDGHRDVATLLGLGCRQEQEPVAEPAPVPLVPPQVEEEPNQS